MTTKEKGIFEGTQYDVSVDAVIFKSKAEDEDGRAVGPAWIRRKGVKKALWGRNDAGFALWGLKRDARAEAKRQNITFFDV